MLRLRRDDTIGCHYITTRPDNPGHITAGVDHYIIMKGVLSRV
jgi:hypothetical protein